MGIRSLSDLNGIEGDKVSSELDIVIQTYFTNTQTHTHTQRERERETRAFSHNGGVWG